MGRERKVRLEELEKRKGKRGRRKGRMKATLGVQSKE
jgi:hypothetical protein